MVLYRVKADNHMAIYSIIFLLSCIPPVLLLAKRLVRSYRRTGVNPVILILCLLPLLFPFLPGFSPYAEQEAGLSRISLHLLTLLPLLVALLLRLVKSFIQEKPSGVMLCLSVLPLLLWGVPVLLKQGEEWNKKERPCLQFASMEPFPEMLPDNSLQLYRFCLRDTSVKEIYVACYLEAGNTLHTCFFLQKPSHVSTVCVKAVEKNGESPCFLLAVRPGTLPETVRSFSMHEPAPSWTPEPGLRPFAPEFIIPEQFASGAESEQSR